MPVKVLVQRFAFLLLVGTAFALMLLGKAETVLLERTRTVVTDAVAPILDAFARPAATVGDIVGGIEDLIALHGENARLREENARLRRWQVVARQLEAENRNLRALTNAKREPLGSFISGRVIADSSGAYARSLLINAGRRDGVHKGQVAVAGLDVVGRVTEVGERSARILLLTDLNSRLPVVIDSSRERAILVGNNTSRPRLEYLPGEVRLSPGDRIVTSGHGGVFPAGLPVGRVAKITDTGITVAPFVDWDRLEFVRVIDFGIPAPGTPARQTPARP